MAEQSLFWTDGVGHGGPYSQDYLRLLFQSLTDSDDAVLGGQLNEYAVSINGSDLRVASGRALVNGTLAESDANVDLTPTTPTATTALRVVLRKTWTTRKVEVALLPAADGVTTPPAVTQTNLTTWEISLATAEVTSGGALQTLVDTRSFLNTAGVPRGTIAMWSGTLATIPAGWALCDGTNSTPNLLDKFVKNVPDAVTDPGSTGGSSQHGHSLNTTSPGNGFGGSANNLLSSTNQQTHLPPYYEIAYIIKL